MKSLIQTIKKTLLEIVLAVLLGLGFAIASNILLVIIPLLWLHVFLRFGSISIPIHVIPIIVLSIIAFLFGFRYGIRYSEK
jgi:predicted neutral ceramidase superfamily lipid hydrolase